MKKDLILIFNVCSFLISCGDEREERPRIDNFSFDGEASNGRPRRWDESELPAKLFLDSRLSTAQKTAILKAVKSWETAAGRTLICIKEMPVGLKSYKTYTNDKLNGAYLEANWTNALLERSDIAVTSIGLKTNGKSILTADISFNSQYYQFQDGFGLATKTVDMETIALHEIGHFLGLSHSDESDTQSVMNPSLDADGKSERHILSESDVKALELRYPTK